MAALNGEPLQHETLGPYADPDPDPDPDRWMDGWMPVNDTD